MITITLNKIRERDPCANGWAKVLKSQGGTSADMNAEFTLSDVLQSNGLDDTLWCLQCLPEHDKIWRMYAVWCARQVQHLMTDERSFAALDVAERHARGEATDEELAAARDAAWDAAVDAAWAAAWAAAGDVARDAAWDAAVDAAGDAAVDAARDAAVDAAGDAAWAAAWAAQKAMIKQIIEADDPMAVITKALDDMRSKS